MNLTVPWTDANGAAQTTQVELTAGDPGKPLVLLVHGNGGNRNHMADPALSPATNYAYTAALAPDQDQGWHGYPGVTVWSFVLDDFMPVTGWQPALQARGYRCANYSQIDPTGPLARPALELAAVVRALLTQLGNPPLAIIAHSRGGLLTRKFLKDNAGDAQLGACLRSVVTLHSPHQGSVLATVASQLSSALTAIGQVHPIFASISAQFIGLVNQPAYLEMAVGSPFLTDLAAGEAPLPGVRYRTFGGTNVTYTRLLWWTFTAMSAVPQWHWPPFHWTIHLSELPVESPQLDALPDLAPEVTPGVGDGLVADARARLPYAPHTVRALNHGEVLWDPATQDDVIRFLGGRASTFVSQSVPSSLTVAQGAQATVTMRNTGAAAWTAAEGYRLGAQGPQDNGVWGRNRVELPVASVAPGQDVTFSFPITAPATPGQPTFQWRMVQDGVEWFGDFSPATAVNVTPAGVNPECAGLRSQIDEVVADIADLQGELSSAPTGEKAAIVAAIRRDQASLAALRSRATALQCPAV